MFNTLRYPNDILKIQSIIKSHSTECDLAPSQLFHITLLSSVWALHCCVCGQCSISGTRMIDPSPSLGKLFSAHPCWQLSCSTRSSSYSSSSMRLLPVFPDFWICIAASTLLTWALTTCSLAWLFLYFMCFCLIPVNVKFWRAGWSPIIFLCLASL